MTGTITLRQVEELAAALPLRDQLRLIERIAQRLKAQKDNMARTEVFLKTCLESPVSPIADMDAGEEIAAMREERGDELS